MVDKTHSTYKHGLCDTRQYRIWNSMKNRCTQKNHMHYKRYGGAGIKVCIEWETFLSFWEDMKDGYSDELSIDRIDGTKGYSKDNCRWATNKEQQNNMKSNRIIEFDGEKLNITQWAEKLNVGRHVINCRIIRGWTIERALTTPKQAYNKKGR